MQHAGLREIRCRNLEAVFDASGGLTLAEVDSPNTLVRPIGSAPRRNSKVHGLPGDEGGRSWCYGTELGL
jgi:hypothetical protein